MIELLSVEFSSDLSVGLATEDTVPGLLEAGQVLGKQVHVLKDTFQEEDGTLWLSRVEPVGRHSVDSLEQGQRRERRLGWAKSYTILISMND